MKGRSSAAFSKFLVIRRLDWLRGLDLNQRPLGYEHDQPSLSVLESVAADLKKHGILRVLVHDLP